MEITPSDVLKQLAMAAGFRVHVWDAVENGDSADSYFWKGTSATTRDMQSVPTFPCPEDAWRDCCESNGLLAPIADELNLAGWGVVREPGFIAFRWACRDGRISGESFVSAAEALIACAIVLRDAEFAIEHEAEVPKV